MSVVLNNNAVSKLASSLTTGATTLSVTSGDGAKYPVPTGGSWFPLSVVKSTGELEIMRCTARSGDVFTVTRAQESTSALAFNVGDRVELRLTAGALSQIQADLQANIDANNTAVNAAISTLDGIAVKRNASAATGAVLTAAGTTAQRPGTPSNAMFRYNSDTLSFEGYVNGAWQHLALSVPGQIILTAFNTPPTGFLKANGAAVSRTTYATLFGVLGTFYGAGDGSTTFNLPDLRGEFVRGWDDSRGLDTGRNFGTVQAGAIQAHTHTASVTANDNTAGFASFKTVANAESTGSVGSTGASETRPHNIALLYCIRY